MFSCTLHSVAEALTLCCCPCPCFIPATTTYAPHSMRQTYEQLLKDYNVDLVVNGHVHSYERTNPVFNMTVGTGHLCVQHICPEPSSCRQ
jgi:hypothetical protein